MRTAKHYLTTWLLVSLIIRMANFFFSFPFLSLFLIRLCSITAFRVDTVWIWNAVRFDQTKLVIFKFLVRGKKTILPSHLFFVLFLFVFFILFRFSRSRWPLDVFNPLLACSSSLTVKLWKRKEIFGSENEGKDDRSNPFVCVYVRVSRGEI